MIKNVIELIFGSALFINAIIFIPQATRIFKEKNADGVSLLTFIGFLLIQLTIVLHGIINQDYLLSFGYVLSMLTCGLVVFLILVYKRKKPLHAQVDLKTTLDQLPGHIYWKDKNGVMLGCNKNNWHDFGVKSLEDFIGKTDYDFFYKPEADRIRACDEEVMNSGELKVFEEEVTCDNGEKTLYLSHKAPLRDKYNNIVGIIGVSVDITSSKRETLEKLKTLENIIAIMPGHVYWMNTEGIYLGCNDNQAKSIGFASRHEIIGKRNAEIRGFLIPESLDPVNEEVMKTGKAVTTEEPAVLGDGTAAVFLSTKTPLYNYSNKISGMVGISIDITDRKKAEYLKLETEIQKIKLEGQKNFCRIVDQVVHDIRSPLASLAIMMKYCEGDIPEKMRITLQSITASITDIANNLLYKYKKEANDYNVSEERQPIIVSLALKQLLIEKEQQYKEFSVEFNYNYCQECIFTFIKVEPLAFKRMMSNLINNAVEAFEGNVGKINLHLKLEEPYIKILIEDNGKGMSQEIIDKIINNIVVTAGKKDGSGIGFTQIRETLKKNQGNFEISSERGVGTQITLFFPVITAPNWFTKKIDLQQGDIVIILDDDESIHHAWDLRLKEFGNDIVIKHFTQCSETVNFINKSPQKEKILLLTDFELINQELNGMLVIEKTSIKRAVLVTSYYTDVGIRDLAIQNEVKILPKPFASEILLELKMD